MYRDLEAQLAVVTVNSKLRDQLDGERRRLMDSGRPVDGDTYAAPERAVPLWVRLVIGLFRHFFQPVRMFSLIDEKSREEMNPGTS